MTIDPHALARDSKPVMRNSSRVTQPKPEPVRIDVATEEQIADLKYEVAEMKLRMNECIVAMNMHNSYLADFRARFNKLLGYRWYRFIMWLWPFGLPVYDKHKTIPVFIVRDRKPRMR